MSFLFVDQILSSTPRQSIVGLKHITADDAYLIQDDQGRYCFAPSLIGETLGQLAAWNVMEALDFKFRPVAGIVGEALLMRNAYLGETLYLESFIDALDNKAVQYHSQASVGEEIVFKIEGAIGPLLPMAQFIEEKDARNHFLNIQRPLAKEADCKIKSHSLLLNQFTVPNRPIALMHFDRILDFETNQSMVAEKKLSRQAAYFADHFPLKPVLPLTILLEAKLNLARLFVTQSTFAHHYTVKKLEKIKMKTFLSPGDVLETQLQLLEHDADLMRLKFYTRSAGALVCTLEMSLEAEHAGD